MNARDALNHALRSTEEWVQGNLDSGGACDFCARPFDGAETTWVTDEPVTVTLTAGFVGGESATAPIDYGRAWAACAACDAEIEKRDPDALAAFALSRRPVDDPRIAKLRAGVPADELAELDAQSAQDLVKLYRAFFAAGARRVEPLRPRAELPLRPDDGKTGRWKDAYEKQMELWRVTSSPIGRRTLDSWIEDVVKNQPPLQAAIYNELRKAEEAKLFSAPPVYIAEDMVDLIDHARQTFKPEPLLPEDLLMERAFVYFARPIYLPDRHGRTVNVQAFCYETIRSRRAEVPWEGISLSFYSATDAPGDYGFENLRDIRANARAKYGVSFDLMILHLVPLRFGRNPESEAVGTATAETSYRVWWSLIQVTLRMMLERVADPHRRQPDRHARRRGQRAGFDPRDVIVVRLRRAKHDKPTESERDVEWTHRWLVTGHWRNAWYPSLGLHRQRWIAPYVKGPDDKPLIVKRKVFEWNR